MRASLKKIGCAENASDHRCTHHMEPWMEKNWWDRLIIAAVLPENTMNI
jgi:hypothetical protein